MFILTGMVTWDVLLRLDFDDFMDKFKRRDHHENLIHDFSTTIWQILTVIITLDSSVLSFFATLGLSSMLKVKVKEKMCL